MITTEEGNRYVGVPDAFGEYITQQATAALELQIREAIAELTSGKGGKYASVIYLLETIVGDQP